MWWSVASLFHLNGDREGTNTVGPCSGQMVCLPSSSLMLLLSSLFPKKNKTEEANQKTWNTHTQNKQNQTHCSPSKKPQLQPTKKIQPTPRRRVFHLIFWTFPLQPLCAVKGSWSVPDLCEDWGRVFGHGIGWLLWKLAYLIFQWIIYALLQHLKLQRCFLWS